LRREVGKAIDDFEMISAGDRVMVCMSGGKDSYTMLEILLGLQKNAPVCFEVVAVNLDQMQPGFPREVLPEYLSRRGVSFHIVTEDTYSTVTRVIPENKTYCSLCSRLRRGILYRTAKAIGATKIALGHHRDDILQTFMMNLFHGGSLKAMPAKLRSDDGQHVVIRPLAYCRESDIARYAKAMAFPIIPCNLCGSQENLERVRVGNLLREWEKRFPGRIENMSRALGNVKPSHLMDRDLFDFIALNSTRDAELAESKPDAKSTPPFDAQHIDVHNIDE
ncbi:MAG: tRNA 2-thiocytidine(32) synthetase TtcA, partial [Gammaproteobacteria bacterium]